MLVNEKIKSYSMLTARELREMDLLLESDMTDFELEALLMALDWDDYGAAIVQQEADKVVVPISDWLEDEYYMGRVGKSLYKPWKNDLTELFEYDGYDRGIVLGSVGVGKSTFSHLCVLRMLYEASCLRNPQEAYGLAPGSTIHFASLAANKDIAKRVVFGGIVSKIYESPYFQTEFPPIRETGQELIFPKGLAIIAGSGTDMSVIGLNVAGAIIDEGNFFAKTPARQLKGALGKSRWGESSKAGRLYESVMRRIKSRYMKRGKLPGMLIVVSSKSTRDSFTEQLINQAHQEGSRTVFVKDRNILDVKRGHFSKETFKVLIGTEQYPSKILKVEEDITVYGPEAIVVEVPIDLLEDFESNLDDSLRDLAGVSVARSSSFIGRPERIDEIWDKTRSHPFICPLYGNPEEWDSRLPYKIRWEKLARRRANGEWEPIVNPELKRVVHLDPALTGDSFGLCFLAGSKVLMSDMSERNIEDVRAGDWVIDAYGNPQLVSGNMVREYCGEILDISVTGGHSLSCTPEHPILGMSREQVSAGRTLVKPHNDKRPFYNSRNYSPSFIKSKDFCVGDFVALPKISFSNIPPWLGVENSVLGIPVNEHLGTVVGYFLAEGSFFRKSHEREALMPQFSFGWNGMDQDHVDRLKRSIDALGIDGVVYEIRKRRNGACSGHTVRVLNRHLGSVLKLICSELSHHKRLHPLFYWCGSGEFRRAVLMAMLEGDGTVNAIRRGARGGKKTGSMWNLSFTTVSESLAIFVESECRNMGLIVSRTVERSLYRYGKRERSVSCFRVKINGYDQLEKIFGQDRLEMYRVPRPKKGAVRGFSHGCWAFHPIRSIKSHSFSGLVYNLEVAGSHTYIVDMIGVHNCIGHISHRTPVRSGMKDDDGSEVVDNEPHYYVDFILRVNGSPGEEILFKNIRRLIYQFSDHGFHLSSVHTDTYQSREMVQAFREQGYNADILSVDTSKEPYMTLRTAILEGRVKSYYSDVLERELKSLEDLGDKVDHPTSGSKDLADALCGAIFTLSDNGYAGEPILPEKGEKMSDPDAGEFDESFVPVKKDAATGAVIDKNVQPTSPAQVETKVYKKSGPKTVPPGYKKIGVNGKEEDLVGKAKMDELLIRG